MERFFLVLSICLSAILIHAQPQPDADKICGIWLNQDKDSHIEIYKRDGKYYGKVVWLKEPNTVSGQPKRDQNNPNPNLRNRPIMGLQVISGLEYYQGKWIKGTLYAPNRGESAKCSAALSSDGRTLKLAISQSFFSATKSFTRI